MPIRIVYTRIVYTLEELVALLRRHMETVVALEVPLRVDIGVGASWADAH